jgi:hypothetical protein
MVGSASSALTTGDIFTASGRVPKIDKTRIFFDIIDFYFLLLIAA